MHAWAVKSSAQRLLCCSGRMASRVPVLMSALACAIRASGVPLVQAVCLHCGCAQHHVGLSTCARLTPKIECAQPATGAGLPAAAQPWQVLRHSCAQLWPLPKHKEQGPVTAARGPEPSKVQ